jgi:hypothetical protein
MKLEFLAAALLALLFGASLAAYSNGIVSV